MFNRLLLRAVVHTNSAVGKPDEKILSTDLDFGTATDLTFVGLDSARETVIDTAINKQG
jgi:hypothetical protein